MISKTYLLLSNDPVNHTDPSGLKAGKLYNTMEKAAAAWAKEYYAISKYIRMEQGSAIYYLKQGRSFKYAYTEAIRGEPHAFGGREASKNKIPAFSYKRGVFVGLIHSHPNSTEFSKADKNIARGQKYISYIAVPGSGKNNTSVKKFAPKGRKGTYSESTIRKKLKFSTLSKAKKKLLKKSYQATWKKHIKVDCGFDCAKKKWPND
jgi:hypothetical protein